MWDHFCWRREAWRRRVGDWKIIIKEPKALAEVETGGWEIQGINQALFRSAFAGKFYQDSLFFLFVVMVGYGVFDH